MCIKIYNVKHFIWLSLPLEVNFGFSLIFVRYDCRAGWTCAVHHDDLQAWASGVGGQVLWGEIPEQGRWRIKLNVLTVILSVSMHMWDVLMPDLLFCRWVTLMWYQRSRLKTLWRMTPRMDEQKPPPVLHALLPAFQLSVLLFQLSGALPLYVFSNCFLSVLSWRKKLGND